MLFKRSLVLTQSEIGKLRQVPLVRSLLQRFQQSTGSLASADYEAWRHRFFLDRLGLCLWLAFVILLTFIARDLYNLVFPLEEAQLIPEAVRNLCMPINLALTVLLAGCLVLHRTRF